MRNKLTCPNCGSKFKFSFIRNSFSSKVVCPTCQKKLFVENRTMPYILIAAILFWAIDYVFPLVDGLQLSNLLTNVVVFLLLLGLCYGLIVGFKYILGGSFLFSVREEDYYDQQKQDIDNMKQQVSKKRKKSQEKK